VVLCGVGRGDIPPDAGSELIAAIGTTAKVVELDEPER